MVEELVQRSEMSEFMHERLKAIVFGVATNQNCLALSQQDAAN